MLIMRYTFNLPSIIIIFLTPGILYAEFSLSISPGISHFNYKETDIDGAILNTETGFMPGLSLLATNNSHSFGSHFFTGNVNYDGQTQSGIPHTTETDESLYYLFYRYDFKNINDQKNYFIGINYNYWERFINANNNVSALYEEYSWWQLEAGIKLSKAIENNKKIIFELAGLQTFNGHITADLDNLGYGSPKLTLGEKPGIRNLLALDMKLNKNTDVRFAAEYKYWGFGRSNTKTISNGNRTISILEPESTTKLWRFFIQITQYF